MLILKQTAAALDEAANLAAALEEYAYDYSLNVSAPYFQRARKVVIDLFLNNLKGHSNVLDVNCGTGIDAVEIANHGHRVMAFDISHAMVELARRNIEKAGLMESIDIAVCDYRRSGVGSDKFDAALSNFGGVNFCGNLREFFSPVCRNLKAGGFLLVNSVSHFCIMEFLVFASKGKIEKALRRLRSGKANIGGRKVRLYYHTKKSLVSAAKQYGFKLERIFALNLVAPPLWADDFYSVHTGLSRLMENVDAGTRSLPLLRTAGDFMVLVFRKMNDTIY